MNWAMLCVRQCRGGALIGRVVGKCRDDVGRGWGDVGRGGRLPRHRLVWQHLLLARGALIGALIRAVIGALAREPVCSKGQCQLLTRRHKVSIASLQDIGRSLREEAQIVRQSEVGILGCRTTVLTGRR